MRSLFGLPTERFHHYSAAWHGSGRFILAGGLWCAASVVDGRSTAGAAPSDDCSLEESCLPICLPAYPRPCAAASHGRVCIFQLGSARLVATVAAHAASNVRGLCLDAPNNLLFTCSFDRTVRVFGAETGGEGLVAQEGTVSNGIVAS